MEPRTVEVDAADSPESPDRGYQSDLDQTPLPPVADMTEEEMMADVGISPIFSTAETAEFFGRTNQWLYWGMRENIFTDEEGSPLKLEWSESKGQTRRRFTIPIMENILRSSYRRGNINPDELKTILRRIMYAKRGVDWRKIEGWKYANNGRNRYKWVHPDKARWDSSRGEWVRVSS